MYLPYEHRSAGAFRKYSAIRSLAVQKSGYVW